MDTTFTPKRLLIALLGIAALSGLILWAALSSWAAIQYWQISQWMEGFDPGRPRIEAQLESAQKRVDQLLRWYPAHPDYLITKGQLIELSVRLPGTPGASRNTALMEAVVQYRQAIAARPISPYGWTYLMKVKDKLRQFDGEYFRAMEKSAEFGPWEPWVQENILDSGLNHWLNLSYDHQQLVETVFERAAQTHLREVFEIARTYNRPDLICPHRERFWRIEEYCKATNLP